MAKKKRSRKPKLITKVINAGILLLAFATPISILMGPGTLQQKADNLAVKASAGLIRGQFDKNALLEMYGPMLGAIVLKKAISMVRKTARV